jgi:hypothetical protein
MLKRRIYDMRFIVDAFMATLDDAANGQTLVVLGTYGFRLDWILGVNMCCETLTRISP